MTSRDRTADAIEEAGSDTRPRLRIRKDKTNPRRFAYLLLLLFAQPPGAALFIAGAVLVVAGIAFHGWAAGYLARAGYSDRETVLTVRGPYQHNRNPYYVAHLVMDLGFFLVAGLPWLALLYFPLIFSVYRRWVLKEEGFLEEEFGADYTAFKADVPRWRVRLSPGPARGPEQRFDPAIFRLNHEWHRLISHLLLLGLFGAYAVIGNPFSAWDIWVVATLALAVAVRLVVYDCRPWNVSRFSPAWVGAAALATVAGAVVVATAPLWQPWEGAAGRAAIALGLVVAAAGLGSMAPNAPRWLRRLVCSRPTPGCHGYVAGLGLGLASGTLGGVWVGVLLPLVYWALVVAGVVTPRQPASSRTDLPGR